MSNDEIQKITEATNAEITEILAATRVDATTAVKLPRDIMIVAAIDYVCPECSMIHQQPVRVKALVDGDLIKTLDLLKKTMFETFKDSRSPNDEDYAAEEAAKKKAANAAMDEYLSAYKSSNPKGDA